MIPICYDEVRKKATASSALIFIAVEAGWRSILR
ncbi:hypothetical protein BBR47_36430 [Brevibacillus brevis NBRC 100599]|uniref:Uncharacterized protein n=1 Tax=Brevibacillus brevis (strain 47 / JCM 6285 / NBRC 100599) TaxID=358681 RepID=C0ZFR1_BREBN|nr:hypothetical protein BBR47_36430 [Brevibacillus brevis NBRC 100599]